MGCAQVNNHSEANIAIYEPQIRSQTSKRTTQCKNNDFDSPIIFPLQFAEGFGKYRKHSRNASKTKLRNTLKLEFSLDKNENTILKRRSVH